MLTASIGPPGPTRYEMLHTPARPLPITSCSTEWLITRRLTGRAEEICAAAGRAGPGLLDDFGGLQQEGWGDGQPDGLGGLQVDDEVERGGLLDRQLGRLRPLEDAVNKVGGLAMQADQ